MNSNQKYEETLRNFKQSIRYKNKSNDIVSILLFRNYLTNLFLVKKKLGNDSIFIKSPNAHNIFLELNPTWLCELKDLDLFYDDLRRYNIRFSTGRFLDGLFIYLYVYWETYKDSKEIKDLNIENIYVSVIKIIERVNHLYTQNAKIEIGEITFKNTDKYLGYKLPSIEDDFLNYLDKECIEIPNRQETNKLWIDFMRSQKKV